MIILDLDGCLSDDRWRRKYIGKPLCDGDDPFTRYHSLCLMDKAANHKDFLPRNDVIIITSRPQRYEALTRQWLGRYSLKPEMLIMRPNDNHEDSATFKRKAAVVLLATGHAIDSAYDDRQSVVDVYRSLGMRSSLLFIGEPQ